MVEKEVRMAVSSNIVSLVTGKKHQLLYERISGRPEVYEIARNLISEDIVIKDGFHNDVDHVRMVGWIEGMMFFNEFLNEWTGNKKEEVKNA